MRRPWTRRRTEEYVADNFNNRISWVAARILLTRCLPVVEQLSEQADVDTDDLQRSIRTFLERHPVANLAIPPTGAGEAPSPDPGHPAAPRGAEGAQPAEQ